MGSSSTKLLNSKRLDGKTAIITGSNTGIGKVTAKELYKLGARVIMACRDVNRAEEAAKSIKAELANEEQVGELVIKEMNLSSLASVKKCALELKESESNITYLINNAGIMACPLGKTEDGFETQFGVNHLGHFVFTNILLPKIISSSPSRIINVSSRAYERGEIVWDDLNFEKREYSALKAYSQSKLANVLFTVELAKRVADKGVTVYSLHPGVVKTELGRHLDETYFTGARTIAGFLLFPFYKTPKQGALTTLYCVLKEDSDNNGGYFAGCKLAKTFTDEKRLKDAEKLWETSVEMTKNFL